MFTKTTTNKTVKTKKPIDSTKVEIIEWEDAQAEAGWYGDDIQPELAKVTTVGFVIAENKKAVCIASTISLPDSNAHLHIPKAWIKKRRKMSIADPKKTSPTTGIYNTGDGVL